MRKKVKLINSPKFNILSYDANPVILDETPKTKDKAQFKTINRTAGKRVSLKIYREGKYKKEITFANKVEEIINFVKQNCTNISDDKFEEIHDILKAAKTKNQITLNEKSIENLIEYLQCFSPIKEGSKQFVQVDNNLAILIKSIEELKATDDKFPSIFNELLDLFQN